jgi:2-amino-4-hydroxy-6-hydroxymethyldihydropteridine diphosphokinase
MMAAVVGARALPVTVFVGLGSNLQQPIVQLQQAIRELSALPASGVLKVSSFYETAPVGIVDQPMFINAVAMLQTELEPHLFLQCLLAIEAGHARVRGPRNGPRTLDLDILLFAGLRIDEAHLVVPHPRMHERAFVLIPLLEIAPEVDIPGKGAARIWLAKTGPGGVRLASAGSAAGAAL